jgi:hypothetical protein
MIAPVINIKDIIFRYPMSSPFPLGVKLFFWYLGIFIKPMPPLSKKNLLLLAPERAIIVLNPLL